MKIWIRCLYFLGLNQSNEQIARELDINSDDAQRMASQLCEGIVTRKPDVALDGEIECDEVYVVAGHKGNPEEVKKGRSGLRRPLKGNRGRGTLEKEKPPVFGMIQRGGEVVIRMLANVRQMTIAPLVQRTIAAGSTVYPDEYDIYGRSIEWGYNHQKVCHSAGQYASDANGDCVFEVHVNTMKAFWSLLRSWLRPHRGISQEKLPIYLGFLEFVPNARKRGKDFLKSLIRLLLTRPPRICG